MKINSVEFICSVAKLNQIPTPRFPEIAFSGRSNVGKSSLINTLINRKRLALTSSTPGKTRLLNYYNVNDMFYLVDLPGYGYAKVGRSERDSWKQLIEAYLSNKGHLKGVVQIIDIRHGITKLDKEMLKWLAHINIPTLVIATKSDKLSKSKMIIMTNKINKEIKALGISGILPFSAVTKNGRKEIWQSISELLMNTT